MVFIRLSHLFFSLFLSGSFVIGSDIFYYYGELSLLLLRNGASSFIQKSRDQSIEEYENALNDVIALKEWNRTDIDKLFQNIHHNLNQRINKINRLKNKKIDREALAKGLRYIGLGMGLTYAVYYSHTNYFKENQNEYRRITKYLKSNGVIIEYRGGGNIHLTVPPGTSYYDEGKQLLQLNDSESSIIGLEILGSILLLNAYFNGIVEVFAAFNPHSDDKYLKKYKDMLTLIIKLQKEYSTKKDI